MCARRSVLSVEDKKLHAKIVEIALGEFRERGIRAVKMDDIAQLMHMSKRTLYEIFTDKETLLIACLHLMFEKRNAYMVEKCAGINNVVYVIYTYYQHLLKEFSHIHPDFLVDIPKHSRLRIVRDKVRLQNQKKVLAFYQRGVNEGMFLADINYEALDEALYQKLSPFARERMVSKFTMNEVLLNLVKVVIRGIMTLKGLEEWDRLEKELSK